MPENPQLEVLFLIDRALTAYFAAGDNTPEWLVEQSCDNDNNDGEIIFTLEDGSDVVVSSNDFRVRRSAVSEKLVDEFTGRGWPVYQCPSCGLTLRCPECSNNCCNGAVRCGTCLASHKANEEFQRKLRLCTEV
jgi:hypothetical protein